MVLLHHMINFWSGASPSSGKFENNVCFLEINPEHYWITQLSKAFFQGPTTWFMHEKLRMKGWENHQVVGKGIFVNNWDIDE